MWIDAKQGCDYKEVGSKVAHTAICQCQTMMSSKISVKNSDNLVFYKVDHLLNSLQRLLTLSVRAEEKQTREQRYWTLHSVHEIINLLLMREL